MRALFFLVVWSCSAGAIEVHEALSAATGWPMPGHEGTWRADRLRGAFQGGFHHGSGLGYRLADRGPETKEQPDKPYCPPVPLPGALWLFGSAVLGLAVVRRRG